MNRIASVILLWSGCVCLARPVDPEPPLPDGIDREALKKLMRQLGPQQPRVSREKLELLRQLMVDPSKLEEAHKFITKNPGIIEEASKNPDFKNDPYVQKFVEEMKKNPTPIPTNIPKTEQTNSVEKTTGQPKVDTSLKNKSDLGETGQKQQPQLPGSRQDQETEEFRKAAQMWEQFVGPLNKTPAVQKVMQQVFTNMGKDKNGNLPPWMRGGNGGSMSSVSARPSWFMRQINGLGKSSTWDFTNYRTPNLSYGSSHEPSPSASMDPSTLDGISLENPKSMLYLLGIIVAVVVLMSILKRVIPGLRDRSADAPQPLHGLGPWPIDPRTIADRAGLVTAFEYLSVLLCGDGARVWNHVTIAEALRDQVPQSAGIAEPLAKYYALARYSPNTEQFTPEMIAEARGYLCQLAGVE